MLDGELRQRFQQLHADGMAAKNAGDHTGALEAFEAADGLASEHYDDALRLEALQPAGRALWTLGQYQAASQKLQTAAEIAGKLDLTDQLGSVISNIGRLSAVKTVKTVPVSEQPRALRHESVPLFRQAFHLLKDHPHLYFRYANAQHGSVVSALAGNRRLAGQLIREGLSVAFRRSPEPYDPQCTYALNRKGLVHFLAAAALLPLGDKTPALAKAARTRLVR